MSIAIIRKNPADCATGQDICVVCYREAEIYSIGECDHPVCHECSTRMRVLCNRTECPICRKDMALVIFMKVIQLFSKIHYQAMKCERRYSIYFENDLVMRAYDKLLEHVCSICGDASKFKSFSLLKDHMRKMHENFFCELCVENLKIFTHERKVYTRSDLAKHRRLGDADDTSHRGHPLCEFCDSRFMDNDELFRHLRRDHYYCHFCDADGLHHYYMDYNALREHFGKDHFLCEEGDCKEERFTSVFRTKIDLQAHKAQTHGQGMSRLEARQVRTVDLAFNTGLSDRGARGNRKEDRRRKPQENNENQESSAQALPTFVSKKQELVNINCAENFPSLGNSGSGFVGDAENATVNKSIAHRLAQNNRMTVRNTRGNPLSEEEFPSLSSKNIGSNSTVPSTSQSTGSFEKTTLSKAKTTQISSNGNVDSRSNGKKNNAKAELPSSVSNKKNNSTKLSSVSTSRLSTEEFPSLPAGKSTPGVPKTNALWVPHNTAAATTNSKSKKSTEINNNCNKKQGSTVDSGFCLQSDFPSLMSSANPVPTSGLSNKASKTKVGKQSVINENILNAQNSKKKTNVENAKAKTQSLNASAKKEKDLINEPNKARNQALIADTNKSKEKSTSKNKKKNQYSLVDFSDDQVEDGPVEDFSCRKKGDYESVMPILSSNINFVTLDDIPGNKKKNCNTMEDEPDFSASDFPSLAANGPSFSNRKKDSKNNSLVCNKNFSVPVSNYSSLNKQNGIPPGFAQQTKAKISTQSSPRQSLKKIVHTFTFPPDFDGRNRSLIDSVIVACDGSTEKFNHFKLIADKFRKDEFNGEHFYKLCRETLGIPSFLKILPELLTLLPDISKQQALLKVYREIDYGKGCNTCFAVCAVCQQVLVSDDFSPHMTVHDFSPPLSADRRDPSSYKGKK